MPVSVIKSDLEFILAQIKISEAHAAGQPLFGPGGLIPSYNNSLGLRTVDGTYNNLLNPTWGAADQQFPELLTPEFRPNYNPSNDPSSVVIDSSIRTISNLIVDQTLANPAAILTALQQAGIVAPANQMAVMTQISNAFAPIASLFSALTAAEVAAAEAAAAAGANPDDPDLAAAAAAAEAARASAETALTDARSALDTLLATNGVELDGANVVLANVAPDGGLSAPFNSWFTLFGQFFDHGLDLVNKGGSGTVFIPLQPDDPLYDPNSPTNFMVLTRATVSAGADGVMGTADDVRPVNTTTAFVDQNQTYTSHPSHQVFLRQYEFNAAGDPVATGKLIEGGNGGMATWADVKAQAADLLGIQLRDAEAGNVPLLATDQYGNFIPGPNGFPQLVFPGANPGDPAILVEGDPTANGGLGISTVGAYRTGHAFLADIAHNAVPTGLADGDIEIGLGNPDNSPTDGQYDNELLDAHYIAGDGRANENIGLTAVHHVFHSEHNRLVEHTQQVVLETGDLAFLNEWLAVDVAALPTTPEQVDALVWDGARLFQSAKFVTEMEYQHLVFEEFARKVQPAINPFLVPDGFDVTIDPSIVAEFAHVVYRFGHSMLTETIARFDPSFNQDHIGLIEGFLNPIQFENNGMGSTVDADIAAGAIVRGMTRQVGNHIDEFVTSALRNNLLGLPLDLATINLARGRDAGVPSLNAARRDFYEATNDDAQLKPYESWVDFAGHLKNESSIINFIAAYGTHSLITGQTTIEGKRDAALTIITGVSVGGLEVPADAVDFLNATGAYAGGALGGLENVDLWIGGLAEETMPFGGMLGSTFNFVFEMQMESLQNGDRFYYLQRLDGLHLFGEMENNSFASMIMANTNATHLPSDVFSTPNLILEVNQSRQFNDLDGDGDLESTDPVGAGILKQLVVRNNPATPGTDTNYLRYAGEDHVVLGGTNGNDILIAGIGDDTLFGDDGNDNLEGGFGNDIINGGAGDDIIRDSGGDDNIKAGAGNDVVHGGPGADLILAGAGQDFVVLGGDAFSEVFGGEGNDFVLGTKNAERILGNEGNDWIEVGTFDGAPGDNFDEIFARDGVKGHDVFLGDGGFDEFIAEGGDDIMVGSPGVGKLIGMSGFDWATYKDNTSGVNADFFRLAFDENPVPPQNSALDVYEAVEGLSGSAFNDLLSGSDEDATTLVPLAQGGAAGYLGSVLDAEGIALIAGLQDVVGVGVTSFGSGDIILGGDGNDLITGRGGDDIIDGDKWLNVRISVRENVGPNGGTGAEIDSANSMKELVTEMFNGTYNPGQLQIVREILTANGAGDIDTAAYRGVQADYQIGVGNDGTVTVTDVALNPLDGSDRLRNIERLQFTDSTLGLVIGTAGNDTLASSAINDLIVGLGGNDTATYAAATAGVTVSLGNGGPQNTGGAGTDTLTSIENLTGSAFNDTLTGNGVANVLSGGAGNDTLVATVDNVRDTLDGGANADTANYAAYAAALTVNLGGVDPIVVGGSGSTAANSDVLAGIENFTGGSGSDTLTGSNVANVLNGGAGNDTLIATVDNVRDTLDGGANTDTANYAAYGAALIVNLGGAAPIVVGGSGSTAANSDVLVGIENFTGGSGNDTVTGSNADNILTGGLGSDTLNGGAGNDTLIATVDNVRDTLDGGGNTDTADYAAYTAALSVNLGGAAPIVVGGSGSINPNSDVVVGIENFTGGSGNDTLTGSGVANVLFGGAGNDTINGEAGNDTINGGTGADILIGGNGADTIDSGAANDNLQDVFRFSATAEFGDTVNNFDANGADGVDDRVEFGGALNTAYDDGNDNNDFLFASGNGSGGTVNVTVGQANANIEALLLTGVGGEGVTTANLGNAAAVSAAFNAEFVITAAAGEDALLVINDTNGNSFSLWQWVQAGGGETSAGEITLIGTFNANAAVSAGNFDFI